MPLPRVTAPHGFSHEVIESPAVRGSQRHQGSSTVPVSVVPLDTLGFPAAPPRASANRYPPTGTMPTAGASSMHALPSYAAVGSMPWKTYHLPRQDRPPLLKWLRRHGLDAPDATRMTTEQEIAMNHVAQRQQALMDDAARDFPQREATMPRPVMADIQPDASAEEIIRTIYQHSDGLVVGEDHDAPVTLAFLIDNMPRFARQGVTTLYAEGFVADMEAGSLKQFFSSKDAPMPESMKRSYPLGDASLLSYKYSPTNLLYTARAYGIKVIPIDTLASYMTWRGAPHPDAVHPMYERDVMMNQYAQTVINARQAHPGAGKWLAWMGSAHVNRWQGIPGVAELTGAIGMDVVRAVPGATSHIQKIVHSDVTRPDTSETSAETDYTLTMPPPGRQ